MLQVVPNLTSKKMKPWPQIASCTNRLRVILPEPLGEVLQQSKVSMLSRQLKSQ